MAGPKPFLRYWSGSIPGRISDGMADRASVRDKELIDAIEASVPVSFDGSVWRVVRADRDPVSGSRPRGRWDDGTFDVLYTSMEKDGALAEMYFHLSRGQPVIPSKMAFRCYEVRCQLRRTLRLVDAADLAVLDIDPDRFGALDYSGRTGEYPRTQEVGEAAHFLGFDGLVVPSARFRCANAVVFTDRMPPGSISVVSDLGVVDWKAWRDDQADERSG